MRKVLAALAVAVVLLAGCDDPPSATRKSDVEVDTPALREQKAAAGIDDCIPGDGDGKLPALTLPCLGGGPDVDLSSLRGPMLINLWYSGCGPCRAEMPILQQVHEQYVDRVDVVGLDIETYPEAAISFADMIGATYPQIADPGGEIFDDADLGLRAAYPQTMFVDADGAVAFIQVGEIDSIDEARDLLSTHLGVEP
ncbi:TlpA disulfide reductase family protein [Nocardioides sp.]|uniref:TlpA family protein disulfide reductase n=1 Tax=Nocardioides sp. TaxID=35761 RepID=UPI0027262A63|nr:TlpA disulfide reductase family protein [Nocardioides sp.]MDO9455558.1 TlpA disulfide reductase family protein [Nocardioides sp.]